MSYNPTILNIAAVGFFLYELYGFLTSGLSGEAWDYSVIALFLSFGITLTFLGIDAILQWLLKNPWLINAIGILFIITAVFIYKTNF
ncbi:hypothetical protein [Salegentibacter sediminis]|uniref:hypothetical protein n=1 Tax=Salegentibacter sediminis TaxID=1930251 RepID=UPI0009C1138B|nr:hypothetical protein [Salegentibacter sediminis]